MTVVKGPLNVNNQLKKMLVEALTRTKGNRRKAAILLGVSERTVQNWIEKFDLAELYPAHMERNLRRVQ